ncbi:hypothetical protein BVC93_16565 [Mycobacterium sp. MS1601]|uniref:alpha-ketoacid dehydrogenase subunit beta n=1 Tax=Mycobacterium sp. MS1601 TaxID=1936029 RepID=UPI0009797CC3|nr:alpha-ketoacid dehydrogenase subunit beta [Mycobacterium sp. MS1601]AQA03772.1 hypothetical protein BVC93_16565 [Mycobacterium sp. MS1601]
MPELKFLEAIREGMAAEMAIDENVVIMGEEVGQLGGVFAVTKGLIDRFGSDRVMDSVLAEGALTGFAVGVATEGMRPVVEIMFSDFSTQAMDQLFNFAAKIHYMSNGQFNAPMVVRLPGGAGTNHGPQHSQSFETIYAHIPGLIVAMPSTPSDAYWMMRHAIRTDDPVIFLENKYLYFRAVEEVDETEGYRSMDARVVRAGDDVTIVSAGRMVPRALAAAERAAADGVQCEVVDLRYLWPLDFETVARSVRRTNRLLIVHEAVEFCGWGGEVASRAADQLLTDLDAPVRRVGSKRIPIPVGQHLEDHVVPTEDRIYAEIRDIAAY